MKTKNNNLISKIVEEMLYTSNIIRIYHWQTHSYARHQASGQLYSLLDPLIDKFVEVLQGIYNHRLNFSQKTSIELKNISDSNIVKILENFKLWLTKIPLQDTELLNLRDEMKSEVDRTLYLFTFQ